MNSMIDSELYISLLERGMVIGKRLADTQLRLALELFDAKVVETEEAASTLKVEQSKQVEYKDDPYVHVHGIC